MATECRPLEPRKQPGLARDVRVVRCVYLIEAELKDPQLTVARLAGKIHISTSRLRQLFAAELGVGPGAYIHRLRLIRAQSLLENSTLAVKEVMAAVGFSDPSHFSRSFKRQFGLSPSVCRARLGEKEYDVRRG